MPSKGLPIAALALGLVGPFTGGLLGLGSLVGLVLAIVALRRASREPGAYGGRDVAWAAVAANAFALVSLLPLAMFLVAMRPFLFPPDPGLPEPVPETQRVFEEPAPPPPPPPPPPPEAFATPGSGTEAGLSSGAGARAETAPDELAPLRVGGRIKEPRKVQHVNPSYPEIAKQARVQGIVILEAHIDRRGHVGRITVLRGIPLLDDAALAAVRQWRYEPTLLDGQAVPVIMTITVNFRLN